MIELTAGSYSMHYTGLCTMNSIWFAYKTVLQWRYTGRCSFCDMAHAVGQAFSFQLVFAPWIEWSVLPLSLLNVRLCIVQYDHLTMKLGPGVIELKFSHRLWTLISDTRICKRYSVTRTSLEMTLLKIVIFSYHHLHSTPLLVGSLSKYCRPI